MLASLFELDSNAEYSRNKCNEHTYKSIKKPQNAVIDVYDAVSMSCIVPLSEMSIKQDSSSIKIPDFTRGRWKTNKPIFGLNDSY